MTDSVNHPGHYCGRIECIDAIRESLTKEQFIGYCLGNVKKYVWRFGKKNPINPSEDLEKASVYLRWAIERTGIE